MSNIEDVFTWEIWCSTESAWIQGKSSSTPAACFTNPAHTVDTSGHTVRRHVTLIQELTHTHNPSYCPNIDSTTIIDCVSLRDDATNSNFLERNYTSTMLWMSPPYPIALAGMQCSTNYHLKDDVINMWMYKNAPIANGLAVSSTAGASVFTLITVAIFKTGMQITIGSEILGEIIDVKTSTNQIKTSIASAANHAAGETVYFSVPMVRNLKLGESGRVTFGGFSAGSMVVKSNTPCTIQYANNHNRSETLDIMLEYQRGSTNLGLI